jgi:hypothetical protein
MEGNIFFGIKKNEPSIKGFCPACIAQNLQRFVSDAGSGSRILRLRRTIPLLFEKKNLKTACFRIFNFKNRLLSRRPAAV